MIAADRNARWMNLREARVRKQRSLAISAIRGRDVAALGDRGEVNIVTMAAGGEYDGIANMRFNLAGDQIAGDNAARLAVDQYQFEHFGARNHAHLAQPDLPRKC